MESWRSPHGRRLPAISRRTLIMGVLNVTPDSFSDGGQLSSIQAVVDRAGEMLATGADVLDLGGESTRPGGQPVSATEEMDRVLPALAALRRAWPAVPISIDTYKAGVADAAIRSGADLINDVWGLTSGLTPELRERWRDAARADETSPALPLPPMAQMAGRLNCPVILMHNRPDRDYRDFWVDVLFDLELSLTLARCAGVAKHQIWLDPGFGFAKDAAQNLEVLKRLERIVSLGYPVLVGTSRKSTIGKILGTSVEDRIEGTAATVVWAIQQGCHMVRVHDVAQIVRFVRTADAIKAGTEFSL
ncbi:MAG: dihydropteroate synthase family protein [Opitutaceae bacterium]|nr:dihydropteroate synthase family protein [Opitutaceae bacterium]